MIWTDPAVISASEARYKTLEHLKAKGVLPQRVIWTGERDEVRAGKSLKRITVWVWGKPPQRVDTWIDQAGEVFKSLETTPHQKVKAFTRFNGAVDIEAKVNSDGTASMIFPEATIFDGINDYPLPDSGAPVVTTKSGTSFGDGSGYEDKDYPPYNNYVDFLRTPNATTPAGEVALGIQASYKFYAKFLDRNGITGRGDPVKAFVHVGWRYDNAFFAGGLCDCIYFGDGSYPVAGFPNGATNLTSLDVVSHELAHGITEHTSQLDYFGESGGLNEANSDILGKAVEWWVEAGYPDEIPTPTDPAKWVIGEKILWIHDAPRALRWFDVPSRDGYSYDYADETGIGWDDPHFTSGPLNRWFYFISVGVPKMQDDPDRGSKWVTVGYPYPIGVTKAVRIWNYANTHFLDWFSDYPAAYEAVKESAKILYGPREVAAVEYTMGAIGARDPYTLPPAIFSVSQLGREIGDKITVNGNGFLFSTWTIGPIGVPLNFVNIVNDRQVQITIPPGAESGILLAETRNGVSAVGVQVEVDVAPVIESLNVTPKAFLTGDPVTVTWTTKRAKKILLNGFEVADSGHAVFTPATTMDFKLEVFGTGTTYESAIVRSVLKNLDLNHDGRVDFYDPLVLVSKWGTAGETDLNGDGTTDEVDFFILLARLP